MSPTWLQTVFRGSRNIRWEHAYQVSLQSIKNWLGYKDLLLFCVLFFFFAQTYMHHPSGCTYIHITHTHRRTHVRSAYGVLCTEINCSPPQTMVDKVIGSTSVFNRPTAQPANHIRTYMVTLIHVHALWTPFACAHWMRIPSPVNKHEIRKWSHFLALISCPSDRYTCMPSTECQMSLDGLVQPFDWGKKPVLLYRWQYATMGKRIQQGARAHVYMCVNGRLLACLRACVC